MGSRLVSPTHRGLLLVIVCAIWLLGACGRSPASEPSTQKTSSPPDVNTETIAPQSQATAETYRGLPVGLTEDGYPYLGALDAPVTIEEYSDFQCPFCARYTIETEPAVKENFVSTGQVRLVYKDFPLTELHPNANVASVAAMCVAEQSVSAFWEMHGQLFRTQNEWSGMADPANYFRQLVEGIGLDLLQYETCVAQGTPQPLIDRSLAEGRELGFTGTPSFRFIHSASGETFQLVGAQPYDIFSDWIETIANGDTPVDPQQAQRQQQGSEAQIPRWASVDGLRPDPERPGYTIAGDQYRGNPDAPLVVVEFSDFQCPFCRQHSVTTQPALDAEFVDPGKVMWVFKHFPVESTHPQSMEASIAAECAAYQGKFWEMHDLLFERVSDWSVRDPFPALLALGQDLSLDLEVFEACLNDPQVQQLVEGDLIEGAQLVRGTPSFVILSNEQGRIIPGALPAQQFSQALVQVAAEFGVSLD